MKQFLRAMLAFSIFIQAEILDPDIEQARDVSGMPKANIVSFWDAESSLEHDYIVIGAGIIGLSTAIELKLARPEARVLVLERGTLPMGASSRNAGFACIGSLTEFLMDVEEMGQESALEQMLERFRGLETARQKFGDEAIGFVRTGNYELVGAQLFPLLERLDEVNSMLRPLFGDDLFERVDEKIENFGFAKEYVSAMVFNKFEGKVDSGLFMQALYKRAQELGVVIRYGSKAERPVPTVDGVEVAVQVNGQTIPFRALGVAVCINAFTSELLPEVVIKPGRAQIFVTEPLEEPIRFDAPVHMGQGFWFFRPIPGNRILLGGGRNLDFVGETTTQLETTPEIMGPLKKILSTIILPGQEVKVERAWSGIMGFSEDHLPKIERVPGLSNVVVGFGCNGMGVARGYRTGEKTAQLLLRG